MTYKPTKILTSIVETESVETGLRCVRFNPSGDPGARAVVVATIDLYLDQHGEVTADQLAALDGQKVTLLRQSETMFGATLIVALEGKLFNDGAALLPKGNTKNGIRIDPSALLDVITGYGHVAQLEKRVLDVRAKFPQVVELTQADLDALPDADTWSNGNGDTPDCTLAVFGTVQMPDGGIPAGVWLIHTYQREDDIVEGVLLVDGRATSEHGSIFGRDLLRMGGKIEGFDRCSFENAVALCNADHDAHLDAVRPTVAA